jgi:hypothetical protein
MLLILATFALPTGGAYAQNEPVKRTADIERAVAAGDAFVEEWHRAQDLAPLYDKWYVVNPAIRRSNDRLFYLLFQFTAGLGYVPGYEADVDEATVHDAFVAFETARYLSLEYSLSMEEPPDLDEKAADSELERARRELRLKKFSRSDGDGVLTRAEISKLTRAMQRISEILRKRLGPEYFELPVYKRQVQELLADEEAPRIEDGFEKYGIPRGTPVYRVPRAVFVFYLVEELGEFRVVTLGFEL